MKAKLSIIERVVLPSVLKAEGNYKYLIIRKDIYSKCELTQQELLDHKVEFNGEKVSIGEASIEYTKEINFTDLEVVEIKLALEKLDKEESLHSSQFSLYELFLK